jgi:hypothetical protein
MKVGTQFLQENLWGRNQKSPTSRYGNDIKMEHKEIGMRR